MTIISILALVATAVYQWIGYQNSGFILNANENYIVMGGDQKEIQISAFATRVASKFQHPIKKVGIYLQSNITNEIFSGYIRLEGEGKVVHPEETNGIPPKTSFNIFIPFTDSRSKLATPLTPGEFYARMGDFTVYLSADDKEFSFRFPQRKNQKFIEKFIKQAQPVGKPKVTLK